uniref:Uncharacterized protein n=1 Tax=Rhizophora mucronata TaxID=61149 RepID=A0A2P2PTJ9_RHIMU
MKIFCGMNAIFFYGSKCKKFTLEVLSSNPRRCGIYCVVCIPMGVLVEQNN